MCATDAEHFRENAYENGRNFAKINYFRMKFENFSKEIFRKFGNPNHAQHGKFGSKSGSYLDIPDLF